MYATCLVPEDLAVRLAGICRERLATVRSTAPANRPAFEKAMRAIYRRIGLPVPAFCWVSDPHSAALTAQRERRTCGLALDPDMTMSTLRIATPRCKITGPNVEDFMKTYQELGAANHSDWTRSSWVAGSVLPAQPAEGLAVKLRRSVARVVTGTLVGQVGRRAASRYMIHCAEDLIRFASLELAHRSQNNGELAEPLDLLLTVLSNAGHILMCEQVCYVSERPSFLQFGSNGDLHAEAEPAVSYGRNLDFFYWNGIAVPHSVGLIPAPCITLDYISAHHTWTERNILIARMGIENFLADGGASVFHEDETGKLWKGRIARKDGAPNWAVAEVVNGTAELDGSFKNYFLQVPPTMRRAKQAVAWTYGMDEHQYNVAVRT